MQHQPVSLQDSLPTSPDMPTNYQNTMAPSVEVAQAIAQTKAKYCRLLDTKKWDMLDQVLVPGFSFKMVQGGAVVNQNGVDLSFPERAAFIKHFSEFFRDKQSHHMVGPAEYEEVGPDEVKATFAIQYYVADAEPTPKFRLVGAGHYHDIYKRENGSWLLADSTVDATYTTLES